VWKSSNILEKKNLKYKNYIQEEIKSRLKPGNVCYHLVQNLLSSSYLSKNLKIKICRNIILPVVLYGYETWSLTFSEEPRLRVCENRVLRKIFRLKEDEVRGEWRKLHMQEINELYCSLNIFRVITSRGMRRAWAYSTYGGVWRCIIIIIIIFINCSWVVTRWQ